MIDGAPNAHDVREVAVLSRLQRFSLIGRFFACVLLVSVLGVLLAPSVVAAQKTTIVLAYNIYGNDDREAIWQKLIQAFNEQSELYTIEAIRAVGNDKLRTMIAWAGS